MIEPPCLPLLNLARWVRLLQECCISHFPVLVLVSMCWAVWTRCLLSHCCPAELWCLPVGHCPHTTHLHADTHSDQKVNTSLKIITSCVEMFDTQRSDLITLILTLFKKQKKKKINKPLIASLISCRVSTLIFHVLHCKEEFFFSRPQLNPADDQNKSWLVPSQNRIQKNDHN